MYVCLCYGISDKKIKSMVQSGHASNLRDIRNKCNAGGNCGMCLNQLKEIVEDCKAELQDFKKAGND